MKTDNLIRALALDSTKVLAFDSSLKAAMTFSNILAAAIFFGAIGFRSDIVSALETGRFLFKFVITIPIAAAASAAMLRVGKPGLTFGRPGWVLAFLPLILTSAVVAELAVVPQSLWMTKLIGVNARNCLTLIPLLAIGPLACFLLALRRGAPTNPGLAGAVAGLAASGIAATFYATNCIDDSPLFVATWYPLATIMVVMAGFFGGKALLKW